MRSSALMLGLRLPTVWDAIGTQVIAVVVATVVLGVLTWIKREPLRNLWRAVTSPRVPRRTLRIVPHGRAGWNVEPKVDRDGNEYDLIHAWFYCWLSNITDQDVGVPVVRLERSSSSFEGELTLVPGTGGQIEHFPRAVPAREMLQAECRFDLAPRPGFVPAKGSWKADVVVIDQFGNRHRARRVQFYAYG